MDQKIIEILDKNEKYCSHGDTVNYADPPKVFENCDGSFLFDEHGTPYLDWQIDIYPFLWMSDCHKWQ